MDDGMEEVLRRLEALERRVSELSAGAHDERDCPFRSEERRIVDLVARLTAERVEEALARFEREGDHHDRHHHHDHHGPPPPGWHGRPPRRGR